MLRLLPVVLVLLGIGGGLIYFRYSSSKVVSPPVSPTTQEEDQSTTGLQEVPKQLLTPSPSPQTSSVTLNPDTSDLDTRLKAAEAAVTELKVRVSALEKTPTTTTTTQTSSKAPLYIPLGSAGQISDVNWNSLGAFQISLDPAQYASYSNMQLEVTIRLNQPGGTAYARLYNSTNGSATSSEASTTSTSATIVTSSGFTLPSGTKTYILQAKSSDGTQVFIDNARIKVNF